MTCSNNGFRYSIILEFMLCLYKLINIVYPWIFGHLYFSVYLVYSDAILTWIIIVHNRLLYSCLHFYLDNWLACYTLLYSMCLKHCIGNGLAYNYWFTTYYCTVFESFLTYYSLLYSVWIITGLLQLTVHCLNHYLLTTVLCTASESLLTVQSLNHYWLTTVNCTLFKSLFAYYSFMYSVWIITDCIVSESLLAYYSLLYSVWNITWLLQFTVQFLNHDWFTTVYCTVIQSILAYNSLLYSVWIITGLLQFTVQFLNHNWFTTVYCTVSESWLVYYSLLYSISIITTVYCTGFE